MTSYTNQIWWKKDIRAAQSNSPYVSLLKLIPIVHADSVSKSLRQNFFFARATIVSAGKNIIFRYNNGYKQRLGPPVPKRRQFSDLFSWARVLKWGRKRDKTTEKETRHQCRLPSLHCLRVKCNKFWQKDTLVKPNKWQTGLFQPLKVSLNFSVLKLLNIKLELTTENLKQDQFLFCLIFRSLTANNHFWYFCAFFASDLMANSTGYVIKQLVHAFSCALSSYGALGKFGEHSRS